MKSILVLGLLLSFNVFAKKIDNCSVYRLTGKVSKLYKHCERVVNKNSQFFLVPLEECKPEILCESNQPYEATPKEQLEKGLLAKLIETLQSI